MPGQDGYGLNQQPQPGIFQKMLEFSHSEQKNAIKLEFDKVGKKGVIVNLKVGERRDYAAKWRMLQDRQGYKVLLLRLFLLRLFCDVIVAGIQLIVNFPFFHSLFISPPRHEITCNHQHQNQPTPNQAVIH